MALHAITDLRIVLFGKTGVGKSSAGNTILGSNRFHTEFSSSSVTRRCQKQSSTVEGRTVSVLDTPDYFFNTYEEDLRSEIEKSVTLSSPGVHAFLFILKPTTFTQQEADMMQLFKQSYGEEAFKHTVILFTHGDQLNNTLIQTLISQNQRLENLVNLCGGRFHLLNNKDPDNRQQVTELLEKIDSMVSENENRCYTLETLREAERREEQKRELILEEQTREREREEREHQMILERVRRETEERVRRETQEELDKLRADMDDEFKLGMRERETRLNNYSTRRELQQQENKVKYWSKFQMTCVCVICVCFSLAWGYMSIWRKGSSDTFTFFIGCAWVGVAAVVGGFTGKIWVLTPNCPLRTCCSSSQQCSTTPKLYLKKIGGIICGGFLGVVVGYLFVVLYIVDITITVLTGLAGGLGAFAATHRVH